MAIGPTKTSTGRNGLSLSTILATIAVLGIVVITGQILQPQSGQASPSTGIAASDPSLPPSSPAPSSPSAPLDLIPSAVPDEAKALMSSTSWAARDPETGDTVFGLIGKSGERVSAQGLVTSDWGMPIVASPQADGSVNVLRATLGSSTPEIVGTVKAVDETVIATADPDGIGAYLFGPTTGLWFLDADGGSKQLSAGVSPRDFDDGPFGLGEFEWSATGDTLAASACSQVTCTVLVLERSTGVVRRIDDFVFIAVTDAHLLGYPDQSDRRWRTLTLVDNSVAPVGNSIDVAFDGYAVSATEVLIYGANHAGKSLDIAIVDASAGSERLVAAVPVSSDRLVAQLWRSDNWAVLSPSDGLGVIGAIQRGGDMWDLLNLTTGSIIPKSVPVGFK